MDRKQIKEYFQSNNFIPSKKMGQNFLLNVQIQQQIVDLAKVNDKTNVLEIGPGLGAITHVLLKQAKKVVVIELDKRLAELLEKEFKNENFVLIRNDILRVNLVEILKTNFNNEPVTIIGNLPYSISSLIILRLMRSSPTNKAVFMLQKEMADRIAALPRTKEYNSLTVLIQWLYEVKKLLTVDRTNFYPIPKVESEIVSFTIKPNVDLKNLEKFNKFLKLIFSAKRKKATNNLKGSYSLETVHHFFDLNKINYSVRAEEISVENLYKLFSFLTVNSNEN